MGDLILMCNWLPLAAKYQCLSQSQFWRRIKKIMKAMGTGEYTQGFCNQPKAIL